MIFNQPKQPFGEHTTAVFNTLSDHARAVTNPHPQALQAVLCSGAGSRHTAAPWGYPHTPAPRCQQQLKCPQKGQETSPPPGQEGTEEKGSAAKARGGDKGPLRGAATAGQQAQAAELLLPMCVCLPSVAQRTRPWLQVLFYKQNTSTINQLVHH